ncbi:NADH-quinone oxidoreductase subunit C [Nitratiruptor sp. YY09-18]|uniref:hydrogenase large subunit n=1 Tax=Nitratiruptor sp. YY09-18 TaxID=2724901 RepID=UPI0019155A28|nr:NADH-quinone oxidoreductase subunit C [Nitratiruptor sp. YY09-18]BCD67285.1 formate hydrogenlyase subunit 5 [Nitratiruptor sp. YY09-18]
MRFIARFAQELEDHFEIVDIYDDKIQKHSLDKENPMLPTLTTKYPAAIWFERKIRDDFGIEFEGSFDSRPLLHHERFPNIHPMRKYFQSDSLDFAPFKPYKYETIGGEGIFEVGVGPIHAGIIEPGHFHFSQEGEAILHLEVRHFYKYRGIEKMLENLEPYDGWELVERISGNESIAYQIGYFELLAQASGQEIDENVRKYNALLLELERLAHHFTDLGFIPNDAGFGAALAYASMMAEDTRRILAQITGSRFGFGAVRGKATKIDKAELRAFLDDIEERLRFFKEWIIEIPSLWDRLDNTGILLTKKAYKYSCVGIVARASGIALDRRDTPFYTAHGWKVVTCSKGDVAARFMVRLEEALNSITIMRSLLDFTPTAMQIDSFADGEYCSFTESSLGELMLYMRIAHGKIDRFFARDPSFVNWQALHLMMPGNIIADFPLINKSCDLSYAGSDL